MSCQGILGVSSLLMKSEIQNDSIKSIKSYDMNTFLLTGTKFVKPLPLVSELQIFNVMKSLFVTQTLCCGYLKESSQ